MTILHSVSPCSGANWRVPGISPSWWFLCALVVMVTPGFVLTVWWSKSCSHSILPCWKGPLLAFGGVSSPVVSACSSGQSDTRTWKCWYHQRSLACFHAPQPSHMSLIVRTRWIISWWSQALSRTHRAHPMPLLTLGLRLDTFTGITVPSTAAVFSSCWAPPATPSVCPLGVSPLLLLAS